MFETATRKKFRYPFRGQISTEDLWDLNMTELDSIYKTLTKEAKAKDDGESLLSQNKIDEELLLKIEIVKTVFETKQEEANASKVAAEKAKKKEKLMTILARKQDDSLEQMSEEDLKKMIEELG